MAGMKGRSSFSLGRSIGRASTGLEVSGLSFQTPNPFIQGELARRLSASFDVVLRPSHIPWRGVRLRFALIFSPNLAMQEAPPWGYPLQEQVFWGAWGFMGIAMEIWRCGFWGIPFESTFFGAYGDSWESNPRKKNLEMWVPRELSRWVRKR